jgi:DNA-binding PadR family transcriptional regulator
MQHARELLKGSTEALLLSIITRRPLYGYEIVKELERRSKGYFRFREGTLYPALHRLEQAGFLEGRWERPEGGLQRRYYYITAKGLATLRNMAEEWRSFSAAVNLIVEPD